MAYLADYKRMTFLALLNLHLRVPRRDQVTDCCKQSSFRFSDRKLSKQQTHSKQIVSIKFLVNKHLAQMISDNS